jgi:GNAT superfamily N-acetyltransferase
MPASLQLELATLTARTLDFADAPALQRLLRRCDDYFRAADGRAPSKHAALERIADAQGDDRARLWGFTAPGGAELLGLLELRLDEPGPEQATVVLLLLDPAARGRGHGRAIVEGLERALSEAGVAELHLGVQDHETVAHAFWSSLGFAPEGRARGVTRYALRLGSRSKS